MIRRFESGVVRTADVVVIGAGNGGSAAAAAVARRLPDAKVVLLEAGTDWSNSRSVNCLGLATMGRALRRRGWNRGLEHSYTTVPQEFLTRRVLNLRRGRGLGGSSLTSDGMYLRGSAIDYARWAGLAGRQGVGVSSPSTVQGGAPSDVHPWSTDGIMKTFAALRQSGILNVEVPAGNASHSPLNTAFVSSCQAMDLLPVESLNVDNTLPMAAEVQQLTRRGRRLDAFTAHCRSRPEDAVSSAQEAPPNLTVLTEAHVSHLGFGADRRVSSVNVVGAADPISCGQVIVAAGAVETPLLLQRSGVGPRSLFNRIRQVNVVAENDAVGTGVCSQPAVTFVYSYANWEAVSRSWSPLLARYLREQWLDYTERRKGIFTSAVEFSALLRSQNALPVQDIRLDFFMQKLSGAPENPWEAAFGRGFTLRSTLVRGPHSQGEISISGADAAATMVPQIDLQVFKEPMERVAVDEGAGWAQLPVHPDSGLRSTTDFNPAGETHPFEVMKVIALRPTSLKMLKTNRTPWVTDNVAVDGEQVTSSCALGAATDDRLRLRGVEGVTIADSSAIPCRVNADAGVVAQMMGFKAAEWVADATK